MARDRRLRFLGLERSRFSHFLGVLTRTQELDPGITVFFQRVNIDPATLVSVLILFWESAGRQQEIRNLVEQCLEFLNRLLLRVRLRVRQAHVRVRELQPLGVRYTTSVPAMP
eukprot:3185648-Rhodomonas_salina.1